MVTVVQNSIIDVFSYLQLYLTFRTTLTTENGKRTNLKTNVEKEKKLIFISTHGELILFCRIPVI